MHRSAAPSAQRTRVAQRGGDNLDADLARLRGVHQHGGHLREGKGADGQVRACGSGAGGGGGVAAALATRVCQAARCETPPCPPPGAQPNSDASISSSMPPRFRRPGAPEAPRQRQQPPAPTPHLQRLVGLPGDGRLALDGLARRVLAWAQAARHGSLDSWQPRRRVAGAQAAAAGGGGGSVPAITAGRVRHRRSTWRGLYGEVRGERAATGRARALTDMVPLRRLLLSAGCDTDV